MPVQSAPRILLNMIVKNEGARLRRCLASVKPWINAYCICDTGSTDDTVSVIREEIGDLPGEVHQIEFENFAQARNAALRRARSMWANCHYILLVDADMELVVENPRWKFEMPRASYLSIEQRAGIRYWNVRLVGAQGQYVGATHEYFQAHEPPVPLHGLHFIDHADGANRPGKFERDIALLQGELAAGGTRALFYLAQSHRDAGRFAQAASLYRARALLGGFAEEAWHAKLSEARCYRALGRLADFVEAAIDAWAMRPQRLEPIADLTRHFRDQGRHAAVMTWAQGMLEQPVPDDTLFVEPDAYGPLGLIAEDVSISGFYVSGSRDRAFEITDRLALAKDLPSGRRDVARANLRHFAQPLKVERRIRLEPPVEDGWHAMNPSVVNRSGERIDVVVRAVNYEMQGRNYRLPPDNVVRTRWYYTSWPFDFSNAGPHWTEISVVLPEPLYAAVRGLEDMRIYQVRGELRFSATCREMNELGLCEMVRGKIRMNEFGGLYADEVEVISSRPSLSHQKNWTPVLAIDFDEIVGMMPRYSDKATGLALDHLRGGSQAIPFGNGWVAITHEAIDDDPATRHYLHRFVYLGPKLDVVRVSRPFKLSAEPIEFVAGLAWVPGESRLAISYGVADREAWIAYVTPSTIADMMGDPALSEART